MSAGQLYTLVMIVLEQIFQFLIFNKGSTWIQFSFQSEEFHCQFNLIPGKYSSWHKNVKYVISLPKKKFTWHHHYWQRCLLLLIFPFKWVCWKILFHEILKITSPQWNLTANFCIKTTHYWLCCSKHAVACVSQKIKKEKGSFQTEFCF